MNERDAPLRAALAAIWAKSRPRMLEQLDVLDTAANACARGQMTPQQCQEAEREAHRLAGSAGSFGFRDATDAARELELMLGGRRELDPDRFSELVRIMRRILDTDRLPLHENDSR